jgi:hypothetical protein
VSRVRLRRLIREEVGVATASTERHHEEEGREVELVLPSCCYLNDSLDMGYVLGQGKSEYRR